MGVQEVFLEDDNGNCKGGSRFSFAKEVKYLLNPSSMVE